MGVMLSLNENEKKYLLKLSRKTLEDYFVKKEKSFPDPKHLPSEKLAEKRGTFVTLKKNGKLRGCVGHVFPTDPIYVDIIENTLSAGFDDPRFPPLEKPELAEVRIEISVLTTPEKLEYSSTKELLEKIRPGKDGVILVKGYRQSTFLPQVWEKIPDKENFLGHLCLKAGLLPDEWIGGDVSFYIYQVDVMSER